MQTAPSLSVCISTFNRSAYIGGTLASIACQLTEGCEVVVSDNASTDDTKGVVQGYCDRFPTIRYVRHDTNNGADSNYDRAVSLARGEYCWLMTDDDFFKPGAISTVLGEIRNSLSLIVVNTEGLDVTMKRVLVDRFLDKEEDRIYVPSELDDLFADAAMLMTFVGCIIIKRNVWLTRERRKYYGSWFIHLGVVFQSALPGNALLIAAPLVSYRDGNSHSYSSNVFEVSAVARPALLWSLAPSDWAKKRVCKRETWASPGELLLYRAIGCYSIREFVRHVRPSVRNRMVNPPSGHVRSMGVSCPLKNRWTRAHYRAEVGTSAPASS